MDYRIVVSGDCIHHELMRVYEDSFPENERVQMDSLLSGYLGKKTQVVVAEKDNQLIGFYCTVSDADLTFLFYIAVTEKERSKGYGKEMLERIKNTCHSPIILNIEYVGEDMSPTDNRMRRRAFYLKNGFKDVGMVLFDEQGVFTILSDGPFE